MFEHLQANTLSYTDTKQHSLACIVHSWITDDPKKKKRTHSREKTTKEIKTTEHAISLEYPVLNQAAAVTATTTTK